jgi:hypothetical protein
MRPIQLTHIGTVQPPITVGQIRSGQMSAFAPTQTWASALKMSAFGMKADIVCTRGDVVFDPPMPRRPARRIFRATPQAENGRAVTNPACSELILLVANPTQRQTICNGWLRAYC